MSEGRRQSLVWRVTTAAHLSGAAALGFASYMDRHEMRLEGIGNALFFWGLVTFCLCPLIAVVIAAEWNSTWRVVAALLVTCTIEATLVLAFIPLVQ